MVCILSIVSISTSSLFNSSVTLPLERRASAPHWAHSPIQILKYDFKLTGREIQRQQIAEHRASKLDAGVANDAEQHTAADEEVCGAGSAVGGGCSCWGWPIEAT